MRGIDLLIPEARVAAEKFLSACQAQGLNVLITDTLRTEIEQNILYAQGRTTPGEIVTSLKYPRSLHNWGTAWDFCRPEKGREYDDSDGFFERVGAVAESLGLVWGGHFKNPDRPHVQLAKYAPDKTALLLIGSYASPDDFIAEKRAEAAQTDIQGILDAITPEIAAEIVLRAFTAMKDLPCKSAEEAEAMQWAADNGIYRGDTSGNLMPQKPLTRAEFAVICQRSINEDF